MKRQLILSLLLFSLSLFAQHKGVFPVNNQQLTISNQTTYAVVVGISDYQDEGIPDLRFADKDAEAFAAFLRSPAGGSVDDGNLRLLLNEKATAAQFAIALDWLWEVVKENDRAIIYFSGHGDVERKSITQPGFLLCWDAPARVYMAGGALALPMFQEVISTLSLINKAQVLVITDACRSGKLSGSQINGNQLTNAHLQQRFANEIKILSCQPDEFSIEGEQWGGGRGAFSYHLLDGLYGMADSNADNSIDLKEIGRYLEDHVTEEVNPQKQNPMIIGDKTEKLTDIFPELLSQLKDDRKTHMPIFAATEHRVLEENILVAADSNIIEMYMAFKQAIKDKQFLEPANACADFYYEKLSTEPQLEKLHSNMRRNYAAALQDDAQQEMNRLLKTGLDDYVLANKSTYEQVKSYPDYLQRAAELLGKDHYMYATLQARKNLFLGKIQEEYPAQQLFYKRALAWQPNMPHAYMELINTWDQEHPDSAEYYATKASEQVPSWVVPYTKLSRYYRQYWNNLDRAEELLNKAGQIDSMSILVWYRKAKLYLAKRDFTTAEKWLLKTVESSTGDICFPCAYNDLGGIYNVYRKFDLAEKYLKKAIELDSSFAKAYVTIAGTYGMRRMFGEAEAALKKSIELDDASVFVYQNLGSVMAMQGRVEEAIPYYLKVMEMDSTKASAYSDLGACYNDLGKIEEAEIYLKKALLLDSADSYALNTLGIIYTNNKRYQEAEEILMQSLQLDSMHAPVWVNLGGLYFDTNRMDKVEATYQKALAINYPYAHPFAHDGLGKFYMAAGRFSEAEDQFNKALAINPDHIASTLNLVSLYLKTGQLSEADALLKIAVESHPDIPETFVYLAHLTLQNNQPKQQAWLHIEKSFELGLSSESDAFVDMQSNPVFEEIRKEAKWEELIKKYFPNYKRD